MKHLGKRSRQQWIAILVAAIIVLGLFLYVILTLPGDFVFEENLDEVAVTISSKEGDFCQEVTLKEMSYYIMLSEANVNEMAEVYNSENTNQFWNIFTNHTFIKNKAKEVAYEACVRDVIYAHEAEMNGITLTNEEQAQAEQRASDVADGLTLKQQEVTKLTKEDLIPILSRVSLASKYANYLVDTMDFSASEHMPEVEVEVGGDYYESVKATYTIVNAKFWEDINLGHITVEQITN